MEAIWSLPVRSEVFQKAFPHSTIFPVHSTPQIRYVSLTLHMRVERPTRNPRSRSKERFSSQPGPVDQPDRTNPHTESYICSSWGDQVETPSQVGRGGLCRSQVSSHGGGPERQQCESRGTRGRGPTSMSMTSVTPLSCVRSLEAQVFLTSSVENPLAVSHC